MGPTDVPSRRQFLQIVGAGAAVLGTGLSPVSPAYAARPDGADRLTVLAYNENAFGMFPSAREAVVAAAARGNRYPKQAADALRDDIARSLSVDADMICLGSGSIEPLKIVTELFCSSGRGPLVPEPTFEAVVSYAGLSEIAPIKVPLTADQSIDLERMLAAANDAGLAYVCNPNNPTAKIVDKTALHEFIERVPPNLPVLVDEAYHEWVDNPRYESCVKYVKEGRNVIVLRTFSKVYGLAGLRIGYAVAGKDTIKRMEPRRLQNSVNAVGLAAARASLADQRAALAVRTRNARIRSRFVTWLEQHELHAIPSETNFVMFDTRRPVPPLIEAMKKRGFLVGRLFPALPTHLRVSLGTEEQMARFLPLLGEALRA